MAAACRARDKGAARGEQVHGRRAAGSSTGHALTKRQASLKEIGRGPWTNRPSAVQCGHCERRWDVGLSAKKDELATAKAKAMRPVEEAPNGGVVDDEMGSDQEEELESTVIVTTQEFATNDDLLKLPRDLNEDWTAEGCFAIFLPKQSTVEVSRLEEELADMRKLLWFQVKKLPGTTAADAAGTKKRIAALEKLIEKVWDGTATAALAACEYEVARGKFEENVKGRTARADAAAETATTRWP